MTRPLRLEMPDGIHHVTARGNAKEVVFADRGDYTAFLALLRQTIERFGWLCLSYCLLPNHYHLVVRTPGNLSRGMRQLNGVYAQSYNRRRERCGHLWQGRFHASLVQRNEYLLEAVRYVALNPVRAGLCAKPEEWPWGSYPALAGFRHSTVVSVSEVLGLFAGDPARTAADAYAAFVLEGLGKELPEPPAPVHGDRPFRRMALGVTKPTVEIPSRERCAGRPSLEELLRDYEPEDAIIRAYRSHGYLMREIAAALGCHYSTVSRRLHAIEMRDCKT